MASRTVCFLPIVAALTEVENFVNGVSPWSADINDHQREFFAKYYKGLQRMAQGMNELRAKGSLSVDEVNKFLSENGFSIQLEKGNPGDIYSAGIFDLLINWLIPGNKTTIFTDDNRQFPGVRFAGSSAVSFKSYNVGGHANPVLNLLGNDELSRDYDFYMTVPTRLPEDDFALMAMVEQMIPNRNGVVSLSPAFTSVSFPMVDLDQEEDISWLSGASTMPLNGGDPLIIGQALQQTKLRMNENGARVQSAAAVQVFRLGFSPDDRPYVINKPFLVFLTRRVEGQQVPIFAAYVDYEDWKEPAGLE